jgi:hypothetical protein
MVRVEEKQMRTPRLTAEFAFGPPVGTYAQRASGSPAGVALAPQAPDPCGDAGIDPNALGACHYPSGYIDNSSDCANCCRQDGDYWVSRDQPPVVLYCSAAPAAGGS